MPLEKKESLGIRDLEQRMTKNQRLVTELVKNTGIREIFEKLMEPR